MTPLTLREGVCRKAFADVLQEVESLYQQGLYLDAHLRSQAGGSLETWRGPEGRILAGRLSSSLGAPRMGQTLLRLAYREHPTEPRVIYFHALAMLRRNGPLKTQVFMKTRSLDNAAAELRADWELLKARTLNAFRDFQRADEHLVIAEQLAPDRPWVHVEKANILFTQDKHAEALETAQHALKLAPWYRPGIQLAAYLLLQANRDDEALELLQRAMLKLQSGDVVAQLAALETELELYEEAFEHYQEAERLFPLSGKDRREQHWLAGRQSDAAYHLGDFKLAAEKAEQAENGFFQVVAKRLRSEHVQGERVIVPVGFVRQHHDTCAPATLAALSDHWSMPVDHLDVVQRICYDGTPAHSERKWANEHGFATREFRVTLEATKALIDRGVPFTLTTIGPQMGHLQAVVGYDERRGTLLIRDPSERHMTECLAEEMIEHYASSGPRGMALVPCDKSGLLDQIELPDAEQYDLYYELELALQDHDRELACEALARMQALDADHRLTINARSALARYDANDIESLVCLDLLLDRYPQDVNLRLAKLSCLANLGRSQERRQMLEQIAVEDGCDPLFWLQLCRDLSEDARQEGHVEELLYQTLRYRPTDAAALGQLGDLRWRQQQRQDAYELYRLAACSNDKSEGRSGTFFSASRYLQRTDEAIQFLQDRQSRFGTKSTWPARTLASAYEQNGQASEALAVIDAAMKQHPDDGEFLLVAADTCARYGKYRRSQQILAAAEDKCHRTSWLRANGYLAVYVARQDAALVLWQQVLQAEPLARDAHQQIANLLAELHGMGAALEHLDRTVQQFPTNYALAVLRIEWLRETPDECERALRHLLATHATDAWAHRELAISLLAQRRWNDAMAAVAEAEKLEPTSPVVHVLRSEVNQALGQAEAAKESCRAALRTDVDYEAAIHSLMSLCYTKAERLTELEIIRTELAKQVIQGDTIFAFCQYASGTLENAALLGILQQILSQRADLWQVWAAVTLHLVEMERLEEADIVAREMVERFPLMPSCWLYLSRVQAAANNSAQQVKALEQALVINPTWTMAARQLAEAYAEQGQTPKAEKILRRAILQSPREPENLGCLAELLWNMGRRVEAIDTVRRAVGMAPGYQWGWDALSHWGQIVGQRHLATEAARSLTKTRPHEPRSWLVLAESLQTAEDRNECLQALDKALELNPRNVDAYSMKAWALASAHRFEEAIATCRPAEFGDDIPLQLKGREAEIDYRAGNTETAIAKMCEVVEADPDYYWAWECLFHWYEAKEQFNGCKEVAEQFVRIAPRDEQAWAYLGEAERKLGNLPAAAEHFVRALEMNPEYPPAIGALMDVKLELNDIVGAKRVLESYQAVLNELDRQIWQVHIATAEQERDVALQEFANLCQHDEVIYDHMHRAVTPLMNAEWGVAVRASLVEMLHDSAASVHVAGILSDICIYMGDLDTLAEQLGQLDSQSERWVILIEQALSHASSQSELLDWGAALVKQHKKQIRRDARGWWAAALVLDAQGMGKAVLRWMKDWKQRDDVHSYMLLPLIEQTWRHNGKEKAIAIAKEAAKMPGGPDELQIWLALYEVQQGQWENADHCLNRVDAGQLHCFYQLLYQMLIAVTVPALSDVDYATSRKTLFELRQSLPDKDRFLIGVYWTCQRSLARAKQKSLRAVAYSVAEAMA